MLIDIDHLGSFQFSLGRVPTDWNDRIVGTTIRLHNSVLKCYNESNEIILNHSISNISMNVDFFLFDLNHQVFQSYDVMMSVTRLVAYRSGTLFLDSDGR